MERPRATLWLLLTILTVSLSAVGFAGNRARGVIASMDRKSRTAGKHSLAPPTRHVAGRSREVRRPIVLPVSSGANGIFIPAFSYDDGYQTDAVGGHGIRRAARNAGILAANFEEALVSRHETTDEPKLANTTEVDAFRLESWDFDLRDPSTALSWKVQRSSGEAAANAQADSAASESVARVTPEKPDDSPASGDLVVQPSAPAVARLAHPARSAASDVVGASGRKKSGSSKRRSSTQPPARDHVSPAPSTAEILANLRHSVGDELALELNALNDGIPRTAAEIRDYVGHVKAVRGEDVAGRKAAVGPKATVSRKELVDSREAAGRADDVGCGEFPGCEDFVGCDGYPGRPIVAAEPDVGERSGIASTVRMPRGASRAVVRPLIAAAAELVGGLGDSLSGLASQLETLAGEPVAPEDFTAAASESPAGRASSVHPVAGRDDDDVAR